MERLPGKKEIEAFVLGNEKIKALIRNGDEESRFGMAKEYLLNNEVLSAWKVLLAKS